MIHIVVQEEGLPVWLDVVEPTPAELYGLAENYGLHPELVKDCLEPAHLPKLEKYEDTTFIIIRHFDLACGPHEDSVPSMTRKLAFFIGDRFLISVHRTDQAFLEPIRAKYRDQKKPFYLQVALLEILLAAVETYHAPLEEMESQIHSFERLILKNHETLENWEKVFRVKCRLSVIKRILWHSLDTVHKFVPFSSANLPLRQDLCDRIESLSFFADSLLDDLNALLNIQLSLATHKANEATHRTNHVMKVLTVFSAFFLPLNFIVGVYGMNFENMPELKMKYGYLAIWGVLVLTTVSIYTWFVRKGWIRIGHLS